MLINNWFFGLFSSLFNGGGFFSGSSLGFSSLGSGFFNSLEGIFGAGFVGSGSRVVDWGSVVGSGVVDGGRVVRSGFVVNGSRVWLVDRSRVGHRLVDGSRGRFVDRSGVGFGSRVGLVGRSRVGSGFVFRVCGFSFIFHISDIAVRSSTVRNNLNTTVGKVNTVFSSSIVVITALLLAENGSVVGIVDTIFVVIHWGEDGLSGGIAGGWGSSGDGTGNSQKAGGNSDLNDIILRLYNLKLF